MTIMVKVTLQGLSRNCPNSGAKLSNNKLVKLVFWAKIKESGYIAANIKSNMQLNHPSNGFALADS